VIRNGQLNIQQARQAQETILKSAVQARMYMDAPMRLAILQNKIAQGEFAASIEVPVVLTDSRMQYQPDQVSRPSFLFNPGSMYPVATRQDEAGYGLEYREHIL
jgi:hypothetical protein